MTLSKKLFSLFITILSGTTPVNSQGQANSRLLSQNEIAAIFSDSLIKELNLEKPIYKIYKYTDKTGNYFTLFKEIKGPYILNNNDTANIRVTAINIQMESGRAKKMWTIEKAVLPDFIVGVQDINFAEDFIEFNDYDNDSVIEPIIVYQTLTELCLSIIYKNQIISIACQFKGFDNKTLSVDKSFYDLPQSIKIYAVNKLHAMETSMNFALPRKWQNKMKKQQTLIRS